MYKGLGVKHSTPSPFHFLQTFSKHYLEIRFTISLHLLFLGRSDCLSVPIDSAAEAIAVPVYQIIKHAGVPFDDTNIDSG